MSDPNRDTLRASVFDVFVELGILDENRAISDLLFSSEEGGNAYEAELEGEIVDDDSRTIYGDHLGVETPIIVPTTPTKSRFSMIKSRFSPRKTSRNGSRDMDEGYASTSSARPRSRIRKRTVTNTPASSISKGSSSSFFSRRRKDTQHDESEWEWEEVTRPSLDCDPGLTSPDAPLQKYKALRRPNSLKIMNHKPKATRSSSASSLPSSPFLFVVPQFPSIEGTMMDDPPTPDTLMRQYASRRQMPTISLSQVRKSKNLLDNDDNLITLPRPLSYDDASSTSTTPSSCGPTVPLVRSTSLSSPPVPASSLPLDQLPHRQIPFPTS